MDITPDNPRNCKSSPKDYYRIHCAIPLIDHIISQLKTRFDSLIQKSSKICRLLPSRICSLNHEEIDSLSTELYNIYHVDLETKQDVKNEITRWAVKWSSASKNDLPVTILECLKQIKKEFYPIYLTYLKTSLFSRSQHAYVSAVFLA